MVIQKNMTKKPRMDRYNEDKLYDEIQNKVHRHMGIFNSKKTIHHTIIIK